MSCYPLSDRAQLPSATALSPGFTLYFPGGPSGQEPTCQYRRHERHGFDPWVRKIPWRRTQQPPPVFLPGEFHGQRSLKGYRPGHKEADTAEGSEHACMNTLYYSAMFIFLLRLLIALRRMLPFLLITENCTSFEVQLKLTTCMRSHLKTQDMPSFPAKEHPFQQGPGRGQKP